VPLAVAKAFLIASLLGVLFASVYLFSGTENTTRLLVGGAVVGVWAFAAQTIDRVYGPKK
jgi:hypothetical protein